VEEESEKYGKYDFAITLCSCSLTQVFHSLFDYILLRSPTFRHQYCSTYVVHVQVPFEFLGIPLSLALKKHIIIFGVYGASFPIVIQKRRLVLEL